MTPLFEDATEEAIINALLGAETMSGINGNTVYALPPEAGVEEIQPIGRVVFSDSGKLVIEAR